MNSKLTKMGLSVAAMKRIAQRSPYEVGQQAEWEKHLFNPVKGGISQFAEDLNRLISSTLDTVGTEEREAMYDALNEFLTDFYMPSDYGSQ